VKLGAALRDQRLFARIDDDQIEVASPAELLALRWRLVNECHEHRVALSGGAFDAGIAATKGGVPARMHLDLGGDRCRFGLDIGEGTATWSYTNALAHHARTYDAVAAYLRACGASVPADMLERIEMFEPDSVSEFDGVTLNHIDQGRSWDVVVACDTTAELLACVERARRWAEQHQAELKTGVVGFPPVMTPELYLDMSWAAPDDFDQEEEIVRALASDPDLEGHASSGPIPGELKPPEPLLFRLVRKRMYVGIRQESGRVWLLLEPRGDRVVKANDSEYGISVEELVRIGRAARIRGAVERELRAHLAR
jgi:hypothetical protein